MTRAALAAALELSCLLNRLMRGRLQLATAERAALRLTVARVIAALRGGEIGTGDRIGEEEAQAAFLALTEALAAAGISNATMVAWFNDTAFERVRGEHHAGHA